MNIAVVGAGPLGTWFAVHLARGGADVTLVKRHAASATERFHLVPELFGSPFDVELKCTGEVPTGVDVVVVAVRAEQLTVALLSTLRACEAKAVLVFSPIMGALLDEWRAQLPGLAIGMPVLAAEFASRNDSPRELHYWQLPSTLIERGPGATEIAAVVATLERGRAFVRWVSDAQARTLANTVALFPLHVAVFRNSRLRAWVNDTALRAELAQAVRRSVRLAKRLGPIEPVLALLVWWLSSAPRIAIAVWFASTAVPRVCAFVERHFGAKLGRQHRVLADEIQRLAELHAVANPLSDEWLASLPEVMS